jgi:hypothetical protein
VWFFPAADPSASGWPPRPCGRGRSASLRRLVAHGPSNCRHVVRDLMLVRSGECGPGWWVRGREEVQRVAVECTCRASEFLAQGFVGPDPRSWLNAVMVLTFLVLAWMVQLGSSRGPSGVHRPGRPISRS